MYIWFTVKLINSIDTVKMYCTFYLYTPFWRFTKSHLIVSYYSVMKHFLGMSIIYFKNIGK